MGSSGESVRVTIYGDEYSIKSDADVATTKKIAEYVNLKIGEVQSHIASRDRIKVAVLSAMTDCPRGSRVPGAKIGVFDINDAETPARS